MLKAVSKQRRHQLRYPEKDKARRAVTRAIKSGRLVRLPCEECGSEDRVEAHHDDYSKPMKVRFLCRGHHREVHGGSFIRERRLEMRGSTSPEDAYDASHGRLKEGRVFKEGPSHSVALPHDQYRKLREYSGRVLRPLQDCLAEAVDEWYGRYGRYGRDSQAVPRAEGETTEPRGIREPVGKPTEGEIDASNS